jgi:co-chaperonin GroES (HSP10)
MLRPLNDFVVVKRDDQEGRIGSIIIPQNAREKLTRGTVMAVGPGVRDPGKLADELAEAMGVIDAGARDSVARGLYASEEDVAATRAALGVLMGVEQKLRRRVPSVKVGDHVLFGKYSGNEARIKDENGDEHDCMLMREEEIYGLIEE